MTVQLLSELREPPVIGQFYMVPVIKGYPYRGRAGTWPVIGPKHEDTEFFNFKDEHYHIDARFLTKAQRSAVKFDTWRGHYSSVEEIVGTYPLSSRGYPLPKGRPDLARRKCTSATYGHAFRHTPAVVALREHYGEPADAIRLPDGRLLCPHRKANLSSFPIDAEGMVVCPLHGLKVRCGVAA